MEATFKMFRGTFKSRDRPCAEAARFATKVGPEHVISISQSESRMEGIVTAWYRKAGSRP